MPRMVYECQRCGLTFRDWDECWKHETRDHLVPQLILDYQGYRHDDCSHLYPLRLKVEFNDGSAAVYRFEEVTEFPGEEEKVGPGQDGEADGQPSNEGEMAVV